MRPCWAASGMAPASSSLIEPVCRAVAGEDGALEAGNGLPHVGDRDVLAEDVHEEFLVAGDLLHLRNHHYRSWKSRARSDS